MRSVVFNKSSLKNKGLRLWRFLSEYKWWLVFCCWEGSLSFFFLKAGDKIPTCKVSSFTQIKEIRNERGKITPPQKYKQ